MFCIYQTCPWQSRMIVLYSFICPHFLFAIQDRSEEACVGAQRGCDANFVPVLCVLRDQALFEQRLATQSNPDLFIPRTSYVGTTKRTSFSSLLAAMFVQYVTSHIHSFWVQGCSIYTVEEGYKKKGLSITAVLCETGGQSFESRPFSAASIETEWKKWIDEWIEREGAILIMFYELTSLIGEVTARSCHLCFCPRILHQNAHVQGNNQSINKKAKQTKAENDSSP